MKDNPGELTSKKLCDLSRYTGLSYTNLAYILCVDRPTIHLWMSGVPMDPGSEKHLHRLFELITKMDRGSAWENRAILLNLNKKDLPLNLLACGYYDRFIEVVGLGPGRAEIKLSALSPEAKAARAPRPPAELVDALQDRVHEEPKRKKRGLLRWILAKWKGMIGR